MLHDYSRLLRDKPDITDLEEFSLKLVDETPVNLKPYPLSHVKLETVRDEIITMPDLGIIEPAKSACNSSVILAQKKADDHRFCVEYLKLNTSLGRNIAGH